MVGQLICAVRVATLAFRCVTAVVVSAAPLCTVFPVANRRVRGPAKTHAPHMPEAPVFHHLPPRLQEPSFVRASSVQSTLPSSFLSICLSGSLLEGGVFSSPLDTPTRTAFNRQRISKLSQVATLIPSWLTLRFRDSRWE